MKASHVDGQLKHVGSHIFTVKLALTLIEPLDYRRGGHNEQNLIVFVVAIIFLMASVHHFKIMRFVIFFSPPAIFHHYCSDGFTLHKCIK